MNKRANIYLNVYGLIAFILSITSIGLYLTLGSLPFEVPAILKILSLIMGMISMTFFVAVELLLFLLLKGKEKALLVLYLTIDMILAIKLNTRVPFSGIMVFLSFDIIKDILRLIKVEDIYINKEFDKYCKLFHIKVKDFPKKKAKNIEKDILPKEETIIIAEEKEKPKKKEKKTITQTKKQPVIQ